jgi:hypothetical protein
LKSFIDRYESRGIWIASCVIPKFHGTQDLIAPLETFKATFHQILSSAQLQGTEVLFQPVAALVRGNSTSSRDWCVWSGPVGKILLLNIIYIEHKVIDASDTLIWPQSLKFVEGKIT